MGLKVLLLNFPHKPRLGTSSSITLTESDIKTKPTLHDFHAIIMDMTSVFSWSYWNALGPGDYIDARNYSIDELIDYRKKISEQIATGGVTFCFSGPASTKERVWVAEGYFHVNNYFCCPLDLGVVNDKGDTFYPKFEELKYFNPLIRQTPIEDITWQCYFSSLPEKTRVLGVNRAGYAVFAEIPIGAGKLVMLPRFKHMDQAATILVNDILPQMIHEGEFTFMPQWLSDFSSPFEEQTRSALSEIEKAKRLLYTKDKSLKKAVAFALEKLGFVVDQLPDGTNPDLRISDGEQKAICEVKGHENRRSDRPDVLQLLGYSTEQVSEEKSVFISNHEFNKEPFKRSKEAFTEAAIQLGIKNGFSLVSTTELYEVTMMILQRKLNATAAKEIREKIMNGCGAVRLSRS
jgi:hypothetical protein